MALLRSDIVDVLCSACGVDLSGYREGLLERRLSARMASLGINSQQEYLRRLREQPDEARELLDSIAINVSEFFRDPLVFETLAAQILPAILLDKQAHSRRELRIWSAGCAGGEEAYSVAILLLELLEDRLEDWSIYFFATDLDHTALRKARAGKYDRRTLGNVKLRQLQRFFEPVAPDQYRVAEPVRSLVRFSEHDVICQERFAPAESVFGEFDMVFCRNLLMYLTPSRQAEVVARLCHSLGAGGVLVLGQAESISRLGAPDVVPLDLPNRIFRKKPSRQNRGTT
jgi:chemotaxis methyl-accepting protein methylase